MQDIEKYFFSSNLEAYAKENWKDLYGCDFDLDKKSRYVLVNDVAKVVLAHGVDTIFNIPGCSEDKHVFDKLHIAEFGIATYLQRCKVLLELYEIGCKNSSLFNNEYAKNTLHTEKVFKVDAKYALVYPSYIDLSVDAAAVYSMLPQKYMSRFAYMRKMGADGGIRVGIDFDSLHDNRVYIWLDNSSSDVTFLNNTAISTDGFVDFLEAVVSVVREIRRVLGVAFPIQYRFNFLLDNAVPFMLVGNAADIETATDYLTELGISGNYKTMEIDENVLFEKTFTKKMFQVEDKMTVGTAPYGYFMSYALAMATGVIVNRSSVLLNWEDWKLAISDDADLCTVFTSGGACSGVRVYAIVQYNDMKFVLTSLGFLTVDDFDSPTTVAFMNLETVGDMIGAVPFDISTGFSGQNFVKERLSIIVYSMYVLNPDIYRPDFLDGVKGDKFACAGRDAVASRLGLKAVSAKMVTGTPLASNRTMRFCFNQLGCMLNCIRKLMRDGTNFMLNFDANYDVSNMQPLKKRYSDDELLFVKEKGTE